MITIIYSENKFTTYNDLPCLVQSIIKNYKEQSQPACRMYIRLCENTDKDHQDASDEKLKKS